MFKRVAPISDSEAVVIHFDGHPITACVGDSVASALLSAGVLAFRRTNHTHHSRGPLCMIGNCFECLVTIDGLANQQACRRRVYNGMVVDIQKGFESQSVANEP